MAKMLRTLTGHAYGCCDHCARSKKRGNKPGQRERRLARAREAIRWRREARDS